MKKTLLERAKEIEPKSNVHHFYTMEELDVFVAWVKGEITKNQASEILNIPETGTSFYVRASVGLKYAFQKGLIK
jgi:hypothetical protein